MSKQKQRPSDVYLEVGFENLSHFSFSFRKLFGMTPSELQNSQ
ncbi:helix-turn-helix domain-containing protein [Mucilaginibacter lacusdianchii]|nr:helix-turn-helix domain-containing protein [Mucilaginibacter sp. JXJ CY 39]